MAHRFGGRWTAAKLGALKDYLVAYTTALKKQPFELLYIDAFAGTGQYMPTRGDGLERIGSARIALSVPGFHRYIFIEKSPKRCRSLLRLARERHGQNIEVLEGDANHRLAEICQCDRGQWRGARAVLFLDPYGMQVEWRTLQCIASSGAIDVWYLFPLSGVTRQLAKNADKLDDDKRKSLDRVFGTPDWREAFYEEGPPDLFGPSATERHADSEAIAAWITDRLATVFPVVEGPLILRKGSRSDPNGGPPLFALYFLAASTSPKAQRRARDIAKGVVRKLIRESALQQAHNDQDPGELLKSLQ